MSIVKDMEYENLLKEFKQILKQNSLKFTKQREIILDVLYNHTEALLS